MDDNDFNLKKTSLDNAVRNTVMFSRSTTKATTLLVSSNTKGTKQTVGRIAELKAYYPRLKFKIVDLAFSYLKEVNSSYPHEFSKELFAKFIEKEYENAILYEVPTERIQLRICKETIENQLELKVHFMEYTKYDLEVAIECLYNFTLELEAKNLISKIINKNFKN